MENNTTNTQSVVRYATAYIANQCMSQVFEPEDGLAYGTIFPELVDEFTRFLR